jgi:putative lipoic acid-binding regulatory protein
MTTEQTDPRDLLEFPCHYQFKAVGIFGDAFKQSVYDAVAKHASVSQDALRCRPSGKGTYQAVSVLATLHSYEQLTAIYADLKQLNGLKFMI